MLVLNGSHFADDFNLTPEVDLADPEDDHGAVVFLNYSPAVTILVAILLSVFVLGTIFGNFLVVLSLYRYRFLRTISNFLIGNLAVSDFLLAVIVLPFSSVNECLGHWVFGRTLCNLWLVTDVLCCTASIWNLCIIAFDRFTATLCPVWYREKRSSKQVVVYVAVVWLISSSVCLPPVLGWNDLSDNYIYDNATSVYHCVLFQTRGYVIYSANGSFFLPFCLTLGLYIGIFATLRLRVHRMRRGDSSRSFRQRASLGHVTETGDRSTGAERLLLNPRTSRPCVTTEAGAGDAKECQTTGLFKWNRRSQSNGTVRCGEETPTALPQYQPYPQDPPVPPEAPPETLPPAVCHASVTSSVLHRGASVFKTSSESERRHSSTQRYEQREMRATVRMAIIIAAFCGMWLGFFLLYTIRGCCPGCFIPRELDTVFFWLGYSNSSVNPILYTIFNEEFKRAFASILTRSKRGMNPYGGLSSTRRRSTLTSTISTRWHT